MKLTKNYLQSTWNTIIGDKANFSLEARIFHAVTILAVFTASVNMVVNFSIGLILYGFIVIPLLGVLLLGYYLSKHRNKLNLAVAIFAVAFNLLCGATYFSSEGSGSVNLFTFILIIFLLSFLTSKKQFRIWIPLTILHVIVLFLLEYLYPDLVKPLYSSKQNKLIDVAQTWVEVAGMIALITMYIQNNYNDEKELAKSRLVALEEINDTKNKLFSIVAHDLRAPLSSIENYLSILNKVDLTVDEKKTIEQSLLASTRQTSEMLQNILYWSKDQMLGITANLASLNLSETLNPTIILQQTLASEKNITLNYAIAPSISVVADTDMLQLIVRNLLNNAIKFSSPGGEIKLSASLDNDKCLIQISDTGVGISDKDGADIFSIKHKGSYGTNKEKGVGLGLLLAKNYIELQNGEIWYKNNSTLGTTFFISLPSS
ncbi:HAMP domain-containing sensor histidine kinase [Pedobacter sp. Du54]|uniref:sensor histidine kinase n=1 Tax=Pedobacter anseongensis TaxID=3133439 RepID=UPI00309959E8